MLNFLHQLFISFVHLSFGAGQVAYSKFITIFLMEIAAFTGGNEAEESCNYTVWL